MPHKFLSNAFLSVLILLLIASCNSSSESKNTSTDTANSTTVNAADQNKKFYSVRMSADNFKTLLETDAASNLYKMIYFDFDASRYSGGVSLKASAISKDGLDISTTIVPLDRVGTYYIEADYPAGGLAYSNRISRGHIKHFLGHTDFKDEPIDSKEFTRSVVLMPCLNAQGKIVYVITFENEPVSDCTARDNQAGRITSNPSPPGNPCLEECDNPDWIFLE